MRGVRLLALASVMALAGVILWRIALPSTPCGHYECNNIGAKGHSYWEFKDGKVSIVTEEKTIACGTYTYTNNAWFWLSGGPGTPVSTRIEVYGLGLRVDPDAEGLFWPRCPGVHPIEKLKDWWWQIKEKRP